MPDFLQPQRNPEVSGGILEAQAKSCRLLDVFLESKFQTLDANRNSYVSRSELTQFILDHQTDPVDTSDRKVAITARDLAGTLAGLSNDELGYEASISMRDVKELQRIVGVEPDGRTARSIHYSVLKDEHDKDRFFELLKDFRSQIDKNRDGVLQLSELEVEAANSNGSSELRNIAGFLHDHYHDISSLGSSASTGYFYGKLFPGGSPDHGIGDTQLSNLKKLANNEADRIIERSTALRYEQVHKGMMGTVIGGTGTLICLSMAREAPKGKFKLAMIGLSLIGAEVTRESVINIIEGFGGGRSAKLIQDCKDQDARFKSWRYFY